MAQITPTALAAAIEGQKFRMEPVYVFHGPDSKRMEDAAMRVKELLLPLVGGPDNYFRSFKLGDGPEETTAGNIVAQLNTISMFGGGKVVWLGTIESLDKESDEILSGYLSNPNQQCALIVTITSQTFKKSKLFSEAAKCGPVVEFTSPKGEELVKWIRAGVQRRGCAITPQAAQTLGELMDGDLARLEGEIEKLSLYAGDGEEITMEMVESMVGDQREESLWDFLRAVRKRDIVESAGLLENLLNHNQPAQVILKTLTTEVLRLSAARDAKVKKEPFDAFADAMPGPATPFQKKLLGDLWKDADKWPQEHALSALRGILEANMNMMLAKAGPEVILPAMTAKMIKNG
ncbi:MAG: DNA polymerase III subunit delta [Nitrospinae bacterium]|nr:DNA polymerase III subunit delta [Nitrospinota bacterium]